MHDAWERSFALTFAGAAVGYAVYAGVVAVALRPPAQQPSVAVASPAVALGSRRRTVALLGTGVVLGNAAYAQWQSAVAVYMVAQGFSSAACGVLWTLNGIIVVALQPLATAVVRRLRLERQLLLSAVLYGVAFAALLFGHYYAAFVGGMAALSAGEVFERPASPALMAAIAPPGQAGAYQGIVGTFIMGGRMAGPVLGGFVYDAAGPTALWVGALAACALAGGAYDRLAGRALGKPAASA
jgi:predicted MFS family arabinose efflux permease